MFRRLMFQNMNDETCQIFHTPQPYLTYAIVREKIFLPHDST